MQFLASFLAFITAMTCLFSEEKAPDFQGIKVWINSDPIHIENLKGKTVLIDFWDYSCINCIRTLPHLIAWDKAYKDKGLVIVGVHTPEFTFEQDPDNVRAAVKRFGIAYSVALDNDYKTWRAYNNKYWPTSYLVDKEGNIVLKHIGEGNYSELENAIRSELSLAPIEAKHEAKRNVETTPEIYLGSARAQNYAQELQPNAVHAYSFKEPLNEDKVALAGLWRASTDSITSAGSNCTIELNFIANKVHMVIAGTSDDPITVKLDGKTLGSDSFTQDMNSDGQIYLDAPRKYDLVDLKGEAKRHMITIHVPAGISCYSFTFS